MRVPSLGPSRTVSGPDGRAWTVRVVRYRLPRPDEEMPYDREVIAELIRSIPTPLRMFGLLDPILAIVFLYTLPLHDATIERRPWIVASAEQPSVTMVWRVIWATGRSSLPDAVAEIAAGLERGDPRPAPAGVKWVGYDRGGGPVLPPKEPR